MNYYSFALGMATTVFCITGCSHQEPIYNVQHHSLPFQAKNLTPKEIEQTIIETVARRGWICRPEPSNKLVCSVQRRNHTATLEIHYDTTHFSITNLNTSNLNYKNGEIHQKYNKWVKLMEREIERAISQKSATK